MANIQFNDKKILFVDNKIAFGSGCCCGCLPCDAGETPTEILVTIAGIDQYLGDCGADCLDLNGEHVLTYDQDCTWSKDISTCGTGTLTFSFPPDDTVTRSSCQLIMLWDSPAREHEWIRTSDSTIAKPKCSDWSFDMEPSEAGGSPYCDDNYSTVTVEAIVP